MWKAIPDSSLSEEMPEEKQSTEQKASVEIRHALWVWCHPAIQDKVFSALKSGFEKLLSSGEVDKERNLKLTESGRRMKGVGLFVNEYRQHLDDRRDDNLDSQSVSDEKGCQITTTSNTSNLKEKYPTTRISWHSSSKGPDQISIISRKLDFVRFRLTGPLSHSVLVSLLDVAGTEVSEGERWWQKHYRSQDKKQILRDAIKAWETLKSVTSPAELPAKVVLGLTIFDPRLNIPAKKMNPFKNEGKISESIGFHLFH